MSNEENSIPEGCEDCPVLQAQTIGLTGEIVRLGKEVARLVEVALGYENWEAALIMDGNWDTRDGNPMLTDDLYDGMMELQAKRNAALKPYKAALAKEPTHAE